MKIISVANLGQLLDDLAHIQKVMNRDLHILGILVNKIDRRRKRTKVMIEKVYNSFGNSVFRASVGYDSAIPTAIRKGVPVRKLTWPLELEVGKVLSEVCNRI